MRAVVTEPEPDEAVVPRCVRWGKSNDINAGGIVVGSVVDGGDWFARNWRRCVTSSYKDASRCEQFRYRLRAYDTHCELCNLCITLTQERL